MSAIGGTERWIVPTAAARVEAEDGCACGRVAESGTSAAGENRGQVAALASQMLGVADRVDPAVEAVQVPSLQPARDRRATQAELDELPVSETTACWRAAIMSEPRSCRADLGRAYGQNRVNRAARVARLARGIPPAGTRPGALGSPP